MCTLKAVWAFSDGSVLMCHPLFFLKPEKHDEKNDGEITLSACSETDLTVVLNAWYSAGFYTGK